MNKYKVLTWTGSGYSLNEYDVKADSMEEAFETAVNQAVKEQGIFNFNLDEANEYFNDLDNEEKELHDNDYFNYFTNDGWEYFASDTYEGFICTENLRIEEL